MTLQRSTAMTTLTCPAPSASGMAETISVYERIGGRAAVVATVASFYRRLLADPVLGPSFPGGIGVRHRAYVVSILGQALVLRYGRRPPWPGHQRRPF